MKILKLAAALSLGVLGISLPAAAEAPEPIHIIQSTSSAAFMPYLAALSMGYFEEAGLVPELTVANSGSKVAAAVAAGAVDIGVGSVSSLIYLRNEGVDLRMLAPIVNQYTTGIVYSEAWAAKHGLTDDSPLEQRIAALKGGKFGTPGGSAGEHILRWLANKAKIDADRDMVIVPMGSDIATYQIALEQGQIDGISLSPPAPELAVKNLNALYGVKLAMGEVEELDGFLYTVAMSNASWLEENPEKAKKVIGALQLASESIRNDATTIAVRDKVWADHFAGLDAELFAEVWEQARLFTPETMAITEADVAKVIEFSNVFTIDTKLDPALAKNSFYLAP